MILCSYSHTVNSVNVMCAYLSVSVISRPAAAAPRRSGDGDPRGFQAPCGAQGRRRRPRGEPESLVRELAAMVPHVPQSATRGREDVAVKPKELVQRALRERGLHGGHRGLAHLDSEL